MLYLMLTGGHTHSFSLQQATMLRQLVEEAPLPFSHHGVGDGALEQWICRALAKDPADRYPSVMAMLQALPPPAPAPAADYGAGDTARALLEKALHRCRVPGELYAQGLEAPTGSISHGAAGIAYFLLRMARDRDDDTLLAAADQWLTRAAAALDRPETFWNAGRGIDPDILGYSSLFHHACGIHCTQGLIAHARGDDAALLQAIVAYATAAEACDRVDVAFGWSGLLIGCAMLLDITTAGAGRATLLALGGRLTHQLWTRLEACPSLAEPAAQETLGAAHGWCGYLYATLRWCAAADEVAPAPLRARLAQLAALGQPAGRALRWPRKSGEVHGQGVLSASWCNGAAGYVHLWTAASRLRDAGLDCGRLARLAAWQAYEGPTDAPGDLCCGLAGRAYALLRLYRWCGEPVWLARAALLARRAAAAPGLAPDRVDSLFHGDLGIALLTADLAAPAFSSMPFFEDERWPTREA
jgi:serine/threonine-protein kinase